MEDDSATSIWASLNSWFTSTVFFILLNLMIATIFLTSNLPNNNNNHQHHTQEREEEEQKQKQNTQIARSTSILNRLKSFNFLPDISQQESDHHHQPQPLQVAATQYVFNQPLDYQHFNYHFDSTGSDPHTETHVVWEPQETVQTNITHFDFDPTREEIRPETGFEDAHEHEEQNDGFQSLDEVYSKLKTGHHDRTKSEGHLPPKPPAKMKKSASLKVGYAHIEEEEIVEARRPVTVRERKSARRMMEHDDVEVDTKADDFINKFKNDLMLQRIESIMRKGATGRGAEK